MRSILFTMTGSVSYPLKKNLVFNHLNHLLSSDRDFRIASSATKCCHFIFFISHSICALPLWREMSPFRFRPFKVQKVALAAKFSRELHKNCGNFKVAKTCEIRESIIFRTEVKYEHRWPNWAPYWACEKAIHGLLASPLWDNVRSVGT